MRRVANRSKSLLTSSRVAGSLLVLFISAMLNSGCGAFHPTQSAFRSEAATPPVVVYVVRHAEKAKAGGPPDDPPLTEKGKARVDALVLAIQVDSLVAVYSTPFQRTRDTVIPAAKAAGLPVTEIPAADLTGLIERIRSHKKGHVLVAGHSNTVPDILRRLGVDAEVVIGEGDFGDLFVVTLLPQGKAALTRRRFGDESMGGDAARLSIR